MFCFFSSLQESRPLCHAGDLPADQTQRQPPADHEEERREARHRQPASHQAREWGRPCCSALGAVLSALLCSFPHVFFSPVVGWTLHIAPSQAEGWKAGPPLSQGLRLQPVINAQNWEVYYASEHNKSPSQSLVYPLVSYLQRNNCTRSTRVRRSSFHQQHCFRCPNCSVF